jgi:hypothetical protein
MEKRVASARAALCVLVLKRNPDNCAFGRREEFLQLLRRREQLESAEFQVTYAKRVGIEGAPSEASAGARITPISLYWLAKGIIAACSHCCYQPSSLR